MSRPRVVVVGAGVAGLSAAFRLQQQGCMVTVLEADDHVGGKTASIRRDGFVLNTGATVLAGSYAAMRALAEEAGVGDRLVAPPAVIGVVRDERVHELRAAGLGAIVDFVRTPLLSPRSKLRLLRTLVDLLRSRSKVGYDRVDLSSLLDTESVGAYCDRKLDAEIRDHLLGPVLGGIYVVDGPSLSVLALWFTIWKVLLGGLLGYRGGLDFFARALADRLDVQTSSRVTAVTRDGRGAVVAWEGPDGPRTERVDGVVLTVPAPQVAAIFPELDPSVGRLLGDALEPANYVSIRFALSRRPTTRSVLTVAGTGQLGSLATISYEHQLSPGSAPEGKGLIGVLLYHEWVTPRWDWTDEQLVAQALKDLERIEPGIGGHVEFTQVDRWNPAALRAVPGSHRTIAELDRLLDPADPVQLAGDYRGMQSVNGSIVTGETAARNLGRSLFRGRT
ncbi:protoporphyrinogen/coproporphyrinogen oxidase [Nocardia sp. NPDC059246]|uniref:protoporphyrinogen/coproporphyrinogen oxidase n=1 Tax=unclassified Nocardia TaxID=2637762 RepID=UPI0036899810